MRGISFSACWAWLCGRLCRKPPSRTQNGLDDQAPIHTRRTIIPPQMLKLNTTLQRIEPPTVTSADRSLPFQLSPASDKRRNCTPSPILPDVDYRSDSSTSVTNQPEEAHGDGAQVRPMTTTGDRGSTSSHEESERAFEHSEANERILHDASITQATTDSADDSSIYPDARTDARRSSIASGVTVIEGPSLPSATGSVVGETEEISPITSMKRTYTHRPRQRFTTQGSYSNHRHARCIPHPIPEEMGEEEKSGEVLWKEEYQLGFSTSAPALDSPVAGSTGSVASAEESPITGPTRGREAPRTYATRFRRTTAQSIDESKSRNVVLQTKASAQASTSSTSSTQSLGRATPTASHTEPPIEAFDTFASQSPSALPSYSRASSNVTIVAGNGGSGIVGGIGGDGGDVIFKNTTTNTKVSATRHDKTFFANSPGITTKSNDEASVNGRSHTAAGPDPMAQSAYDGSAVIHVAKTVNIQHTIINNFGPSTHEPEAH
ncbi:hypothetical protein SISNIDRAFT_483884 [Sistotremastrum niveocremeum HHB9708]|uniref:Uncharacterized protein n=1 Tax=Sistotremastrum niveocremeum HHB9708 TaxID=1314777 RepID=A0A164X5U3_9AGAM|nr:hypothetical protein SISNIDRAFT_483884 [Sistotremastrum niveocremeum HHB9708]